MGKIITAIAEGVAQFAGPLGAPIKSLISYQNAEQWERLFDEIMKAREDRSDMAENTTAIHSTLSDYKESSRQVVMLLQSIAELLSQHPDQLDKMRIQKDDAALPQQAAVIGELLRENESIVIKRFSLNEPALYSELLRLVGTQEGLLNASGFVAPYVRNWFTLTMPPQTAFRIFIENLRGRTISEKRIIFNALANGYPGCTVFQSFAAAYAELPAKFLEEQ